MTSNEPHLNVLWVLTCLFVMYSKCEAAEWTFTIHHNTDCRGQGQPLLASCFSYLHALFRTKKWSTDISTFSIISVSQRLDIISVYFQKLNIDLFYTRISPITATSEGLYTAGFWNNPIPTFFCIQNTHIWMHLHTYSCLPILHMHRFSSCSLCYENLVACKSSFSRNKQCSYYPWN